MKTTLAVCVYCGGNTTVSSSFLELGSQVGQRIASRGLRLVYGGANVGVMGAVADAVLERRGHVTGVIPKALAGREIAHRGLTDLRSTGSMHERKLTMNDEADAFLVLPGGFGTMDELFEVVTLRQVGLHQKPIALLNARGFYDTLLAWIRGATEEGFIHAHVAKIIEVLPDIEAVDRWLERITPGAESNVAHPT